MTDLVATLGVLDSHLDKLPHHKIVLLEGDLGAGKTTLVQHYCKSKGIELATSPTFGLMHDYGKDIYHYDLYQKSWEELLPKGIIEMLGRQGVHFVEWPKSQLKAQLRHYNCPFLQVIIILQGNERHYQITCETTKS